jgi:arsenate reductase
MHTPIPPRKFRILFLCTGNSARSILAEALLRALAGDRFEAFSAGSQPAGRVNPYALRVLDEVFQVEATGARSKSWEEFHSEEFDFVITVCDSARETCPTFPGHPITAHWGFEDPAAFQGGEEETLRKFTDIAFQIRRRLELFCSLPFEKLDRLRLEQETRRIGETPAAVKI